MSKHKEPSGMRELRMKKSLELDVMGNCRVGTLIVPATEIVLSCHPALTVPPGTRHFRREEH